MRISRSARIKEKRRKKVNKKWMTLASLTGLLFTYNISYATPDLPKLIEGFYENGKNDAFDKVNEAVTLDLLKYEDIFKAEVEKNTLGFEESITVYTSVEKKAYIRSLQEYAGRLLSQIEFATEEEKSRIIMKLDHIFKTTEMEMRAAVESHKQKKLATPVVQLPVGGAVTIPPMDELVEVEKPIENGKDIEDTNIEIEKEEPIQGIPGENQQDENDLPQIPAEETTEVGENAETDDNATEETTSPDSGTEETGAEEETSEPSLETVVDEASDSVEPEDDDTTDIIEAEEGSDSESAEVSETVGSSEDGEAATFDAEGSSEGGSAETAEPSDTVETSESESTGTAETSDIRDSSADHSGGDSGEQSSDDSASESVTE